MSETYRTYLILAVIFLLGGGMFLFFTYGGVFGGTKINVSVSTTDLKRGLVGHWTFDGPDLIQNAVDKSGRGNTGYLKNFTSTTTIEGKIGQALEFNGTNNYVDVGASSSLWPSEFTVAAWIKHRTGAYWIVGNEHSSKGFALYMGDGQGGSFSQGNVPTLMVNAGSFATIFSTGPIVAGTWHLIVATRDGTTNRLYVDGIQKKTSTDSYTPQTSLSTEIGRHSSGRYFNSLIDDVRIYNRALSAQEVKRLYELGATTKINTSVNTVDLSNGLVGHWTFDGPDLIQNAVDKSGTGNTGYLVGFTSTTTIEGKIGQGLEFDGSDDYVSVLHNASIDFADENFSFSFWLRGDLNEIATLSRILTKGTSSGGCGGGKRYEVEVQATTLDFTIDDNVTKTTKNAPFAPYLDKNWHFVTYTRNVVNNQIKVYRDGIQDGNTVTDSTGDISNSCNLYLGSDNLGGINNAKIQLDDVRIYNRALSATEVSRLYELGATTHINTSISTTDLSRGLVGHWTFDGQNLIQNVTDKSGTGNTGYLQNFTSTTTIEGKIGQALQFNGTNQRISINNAASLRPTSVTVAAWFKPNTTLTTRTAIVEKWFDGTNWGYGLEAYASDTPASCTETGKQSITFTYRNTGDANDECAHSGVIVVPGRWYHAVGTYNETTGVASIYVDGVLRGTHANSIAPLMQPSSRLGIGASEDNGTWRYFFNGTTDDVRIYNRALSANEVKRLYDLGR